MELCGQSLLESRLHSPVEIDYSLKLLVLPVSNPAIAPETSNSNNRTTMISVQDNLKESDVFSKLALEFEAGNALHIWNEFGQVNIAPSLAMNSLSGLNTYQSLEDKDEFLGANEDASNGFGLGFVEYRHVSPGFSPEKPRSKIASVQEIS